MAKELILRKGTAAQHSTFIGKLAELTVITDTKDLALHDNSTAGGIVLAKKINLDNHMSNINNPHGVTKAQVGLENVDNTADVNKSVLSATKLTTPRIITISGEVVGSASFDGSTDVNISTTIQPNSVALGVDTTGDYVSSVIAGSGVTVTGVVGEGWTPSIAITPVGTSGTYTKITTNDKGQVVSGGTLTASDIPNLDASKITSGIIDAARLPAYVDDVLEYANLSVFPAVGEAGKIYIALDTNKAYRWSGSTYVYITSGAVDSVAGKTGVVTLVKGDVGLTNVDNTADSVKNVLSATKLTTARTINGVDFDGTDNIIVYDSTKLPKINPEIVGSITEQVYNLTGTEINPANGTMQYKNVSANTTFTESLAAGQSVLLRLIDASNYTITFPTITWIGATAPTLTANCAIVIWKEQSTLYGAYAGTLV